ncbi:12959_t:CDS:2, partial [Racocetra persica]
MIIENIIEKFLLEAPTEAITPTTLIFQAVQEQRLKSYNELEPAIRRGINASIAKLDGLQYDSRIKAIYKASYNVSSVTQAAFFACCQNRVILDGQIDLLRSRGRNRIALDGQL